MSSQVVTINDQTKEELILHEVAKSITKFGNAELKNLVEHMFEVMVAHNGAGLAAPQIGISMRIFVYGFNFNPRYPDAPPVPKTVIINPEIIWRSEEMVLLEEGCLSVPGKRILISRHKSVIITCMNMEGVQYEKTVSDFEARIVQHEIDHLNGVLIDNYEKL